PDRLLIEASGLAHAAGVIDELRAKPLGEALEVAAVLTLVDPRQFIQPDYHRQPLYRDQISIADVLVANKIDTADIPTMEAFRAQAAALFPPKSLISEVRNGELDPAWLNAAAVPKPRYRPAVPEDAAAQWRAMGWTFAPEQAFAAQVSRSGDQLQLTLEVAPGYYLYRDRISISTTPASLRRTRARLCR
ncbi:hypothetical protein C3F00_034840, partial [Pseudomonas sp. MWU13-2860]